MYLKSLKSLAVINESCCWSFQRPPVKRRLLVGVLRGNFVHHCCRGGGGDVCCWWFVSLRVAQFLQVRSPWLWHKMIWYPKWFGDLPWPTTKYGCNLFVTSWHTYILTWQQLAASSRPEFESAYCGELWLYSRGWWIKLCFKNLEDFFFSKDGMTSKLMEDLAKIFKRTCLRLTFSGGRFLKWHHLVLRHPSNMTENFRTWEVGTAIRWNYNIMDAIYCGVKLL